MRDSIVLAFAAAATLLVTDLREARACSPPEAGAWERVVLPEDGAVGVPLNARVVVRYELVSYVPGDTLALRVAGGDLVAATVSETPGVPSARLITPTETLAAATTYEVIDRLIVPCPSEGAESCEGEPVVVATFTTGADLDTSPPRITGASADARYICEPDSSCGPTDRLSLEVQVDGVVDDHDPAWVLFAYHDANGDVIAAPTSILTGRRSCDGDGDWTQTVNSRSLPLPEQFTIRAIDLAGNVETAPHTLVTATCAGLDEGTECHKDPGDDPGNGCSTGGGGTAALAMSLAALIAARRAAPRAR